MRVIVACECSGAVRDAFIARGHDAISCDLKPTETPGPHYQGDVCQFLNNNTCDMLIAFPPCTYLCQTSSVAYKQNPIKRLPLMQEAVAFFTYLRQQPITFIAIENPVPMARTKLPKYTQTIQPYYFGEPWMKKTCLWLKNLPPLQPTKPLSHIKFDPMELREVVNRPNLREDLRKHHDLLRRPHKASWHYSGGKLDPTRSARTFPGVAAAMAEQWGNLKQPYGFFS